MPEAVPQPRGRRIKQMDEVADHVRGAAALVPPFACVPSLY
eukprot:gene5651-16811_t